MSLEEDISRQLTELNLLPLTEDQIDCLRNPARLEEAAGMLEDLRDRCGVVLPIPQGSQLGGPSDSLEQARLVAQAHKDAYPVIAIDEMATDESRSLGYGNEFYVTSYEGSQGPLAVAVRPGWVAHWVNGKFHDDA